MTTTRAPNDPGREGRLALAVEAFSKGRIANIHRAAVVYDVPDMLLRRRISAKPTREDKSRTQRNLSESDETTLVAWILNLDERGYPVRKDDIAWMACKLLSRRLGADSAVGKNWTSRFINRHSEIKVDRYRKYDYAGALCEDPILIAGWFRLVENTIKKYGIVPEDIYNFDETGFQMGVLGAGSVVTRSDRIRRAKSVQGDNREWVTIVETINAVGTVLPPLVIFKGKLHQQSWYETIPEDWYMAATDKGWTDNKISEHWLCKVFEPYTKQRRIGTHRLLILDGHGSHATPQFDKILKDNAIIPLYMPPHSSHLLQALDVGIFSPLKSRYTAELLTTFRSGIRHVDKMEFLQTYKVIRSLVFTERNIKGAFRGCGIHPFDPPEVIDKLDPLPDPTTPLETTEVGATSPWEPATPHTIRQLDKQMRVLNATIEIRDPAPTKSLVSQVEKACQLAMSAAVILTEENETLRAAVANLQAKKTRKRKYVATQGAYQASEVLGRLGGGIIGRNVVVVQESSSSNIPDSEAAETQK